MVNICKDCKSKLICVGEHKECKDYRKWICPKCDKEELNGKE